MYIWNLSHFLCSIMLHWLIFGLSTRSDSITNLPFPTWVLQSTPYIFTTRHLFLLFYTWNLLYFLPPIALRRQFFCPYTSDHSASHYSLANRDCLVYFWTIPLDAVTQGYPTIHLNCDFNKYEVREQDAAFGVISTIVLDNPPHCFLDKISSNFPVHISQNLSKVWIDAKDGKRTA